MSTAPSSYNGLTTPDDWLCRCCHRPRREHPCLAFTREEHDFVGMLRIKNEARWIAEVIESILTLCPRVFVLDDHSTDDTVAICQRYPQVSVFGSPFCGFNEARDKNWLLDQILLQCAPKWVLCVDGDEVLQPGGAELIRKHINSDPCHAYSLQIIYLWGDRQHARVDRIYGDFWRPSLFTPFLPKPDTPDDLKVAHEMRFMATPFGRDNANLHCSSVPQRYLHGHKRCPVKLYHYGYMEREQRVAKLDFYTACDWLNRAEDCYRHMTQGDDVQLEELPRVQTLLRQGRITMNDVDYITRVPADAHLVHAGPLVVEALNG